MKGKLECLFGGGTSSSLAPLVCLSGRLSTILEVAVSIVWRESDCLGVLSACDGDRARFVLDAAGDDITCISRELGPLFKGLRLDLDFFSGGLDNSVGFVLCRRPIIVPSLLNPLKPPCRRSGPGSIKIVSFYLPTYRQLYGLEPVTNWSEGFSTR